MTTIASIAYPRTAAGQSAHGFNVTGASLAVHAKLTPSNTGTLVGTAFLSADHICKLTGQPHVDLAHFDKIECTGGFTNVSDMVGTTLLLGGGTSPLQTMPTVDRAMRLDCNGSLTAAHFMVHPSSGNGDMCATGFAGSITPAFDSDPTDRYAMTSNALARSVRWAGTDIGDKSVLRKTCTKVGSDAQARWLVPHDGTGTQCAVSKLWSTNHNSSDFCSGDYSIKNRSTAIDMNGRNCTVVTAADMDTVTASLGAKLRPSSKLQNGITVQFETFNPEHGKREHGVLTSAGFSPQACVNLNFKRQSTAEVMEHKGMATESSFKDPVHSLSHAHEWTGSPLAVNAKEMIAPAVTMQEMAKHVSGLKLRGEQKKPATAASMGEAALAVTLPAEEGSVAQ